jgi:hypothetical protein
MPKWSLRQNGKALLILPGYPVVAVGIVINPVHV